MKNPGILLASILILLIPISLTACEDSGTKIHLRQENVTLNAEDDIMTADLIGSPSTGYGWTLKIENEKILRQTDYSYEKLVSKDTEEDLVGIPTVYHYTFKASGNGEALLTLRYARDWETTPDELEYIFRIRISDGMIREITRM